jgi:hypothetical protein
MNAYFFDLMKSMMSRFEYYYFVGDPFQALWGADRYKEFSKCVAEEEDITSTINPVSRRLPACIVPLCNRILPDDFALSTINTESGAVAYLLLSDLNCDYRQKLASSNVFSFIKSKTDVFFTSSDKAGLTDEFTQILIEKYSSYDASALRRTVISRILKVGLDKCLDELNIRLSKQDYAELARQFRSEKESGIYVEAIHKIKGLEDDTVYFIICNSLLEILLGIKNDFNRETNLLYVALTRTKNRLLFIIDDAEALKRNFKKHGIDINMAMRELGIEKASLRDWF